MAELKRVPEQGVGESPGEAAQGCCCKLSQSPKGLSYTGKLFVRADTQSTHGLL